jgi:putative hydrolase of the HAD superfamily
MIKAIIFDLDMCIFDTRTLGEGILDSVLAPLHASSMPEEIKSEISRVLWTTSLEDTIPLFGIPEDVAGLMRSAHSKLVVPQTIRTFGDEHLIRHLPTYRALVTSGYRLWQERKIEKLGVGSLFDEVIIDVIDDAKSRKGKRVIFQGLMAQHSWSPDEVLVVGDNPHSELKAGKELGMVTVQTLRPTIRRVEGFDHYVHSLIELLPLVGEKPL